MNLSGFRTLIGKDADDIGSAFDLLVQAFQRVCGMKLGAVLGREIHVRQHVHLALVDERRELRPFAPELVGHVPQGLAGIRAVGLDERLAQIQPITRRR